MFQPGESGNPKGRPPGSKNKVTLELFTIAKERGYKHPVLYLIEVVNDEKAAPERRDTCAIAAAPYMTHKMGTAAVPRFFDEPTVVPDFATVDDAEKFLVEITRCVGLGELDVQAGLDLSSMTKTWIDAKYAREELQLKLTAHGGGSDTTIHITGGLPQLPGTNINMAKEPMLNGHSNGPLIEHREPPPSNDSDETVNGQVVARVLPQATDEQGNNLQMHANEPAGTLLSSTCLRSEGQSDE